MKPEKIFYNVTNATNWLFENDYDKDLSFSDENYELSLWIDRATCETVLLTVFRNTKDFDNSAMQYCDSVPKGQKMFRMAVENELLRLY